MTSSNGNFFALLALCAGNSPVTVEFPAQRPVTRSFDVFFHLCLNKWLKKLSWGWWVGTPSRSLWRHCNDKNDVSYWMQLSMPIHIGCCTKTWVKWKISSVKWFLVQLNSYAHKKDMFISSPSSILPRLENIWTFIMIGLPDNRCTDMCFMCEQITKIGLSQLYFKNRWYWNYFQNCCFTNICFHANFNISYWYLTVTR